MSDNTPYKKLLTYKYALVIHDFTREFTRRYLIGREHYRDRDQMDQAARSGKQCIAEGATQGTSLKGYLKMLGITRGSFEELLEDYKDFARRYQIPVWAKGYMRLRRVRIFVHDNQPIPPLPPFPQSKEIFVNIMIDMLNRENYLIDNQKRSLELKHKTEGGYSEKLYKARYLYRNSGK